LLWILRRRKLEDDLPFYVSDIAARHAAYNPRLREVAMKINYLEKPKINEERKIHREAKPYLAGIGIFLTFWHVISFLSGISARKRSSPCSVPR
jgi:UDP-N-acetylmuramyl pentapeptide phosphotransferase/UDP-N-acetylglucosamine-1-phosphate transferase